jgi:hypothetical protein
MNEILMYKSLNNIALPGNPQISPSKKYVLKIEELFVENIKYFKFLIINNQTEQVFDPKELFDIRHNTYFMWDASDNVWVYSGDTGTYVWRKVQSDWIKIHYSEIDSNPPDFLVYKYPKIFTK